MNQKAWVVFRRRSGRNVNAGVKPVRASGQTRHVTLLDHLDDYPSFGNGRTETVSTTVAHSNTVDSSTNLAVNQSGETLTVTGGANPGDSDGAIGYRFSNLSTFTMTYHTEPHGAINSAFHHDGHGAFVFDDPEETPLPTRLYYTYSLTNDEDDPIEIDFFDDLPPGLVWDTSYTAGSSNPLAAAVNYSSGNSDARIDDELVPPGVSSFTLRSLRSLRTGRTGAIDNEATVTPEDGTGIEPVTATTSITLDP